MLDLRTRIVMVAETLDGIANRLDVPAAVTAYIETEVAVLDAMSNEIAEAVSAVDLKAERDRYRQALEQIAWRPTVERNPDGVDQAAASMQLIAREALKVERRKASS